MTTGQKPRPAGLVSWLVAYLLDLVDGGDGGRACAWEKSPG